jgi:hypothetical protein
LRIEWLGISTTCGVDIVVPFPAPSVAWTPFADGYLLRRLYLLSDLLEDLVRGFVSLNLLTLLSGLVVVIGCCLGRL